MLKWLIPAGRVLRVIVYEFGLARRLHDSLGFTYHLLADVLIFGTVGPVLTLIALHYLERWLEERDTSDRGHRSWSGHVKRRRTVAAWLRMRRRRCLPPAR